MRGKQLAAHMTWFQFNQLMEKTSSSSPTAPRALHHLLSFTTAESTKWYNGFAIRAAFIACKQVLGIIFGHSYSC